MWAWMATAAYVWNAGFQQFAATHQGFRADWSTAGFVLPALILLVLASIAFVFGSRTARKVLAALSLFLVHIFVCSLITRAAWKIPGSGPEGRHPGEHARRNRGGRSRRPACRPFHHALPLRHVPDDCHRGLALKERASRMAERLPAFGGVLSLDASCLWRSLPAVRASSSYSILM